MKGKIPDHLPSLPGFPILQPWPALFASPVIGVGVLDDQMKFCAINDALASMNGVPAEKHIGRKVRYVLGAVAPAVEAAVDQVLQSRKSTALNLSAKLPAREGLGHWVEHYFPVRDVQGRVTQVAALIVEITGPRNLGRSLQRMIANLRKIQSAARAELDSHPGEQNERALRLLQAAELAKQCISELNTLSTGSADLRPVITPPAIRARKNNHLTGLHLSTQEYLVLLSLVEGQSNKAVGANLGISVRTAEAYRARLMKKLGQDSLAQLVRFAVRNKIIEA
jgi:DNA-binding NarL/FixJ family response regulator